MKGHSSKRMNHHDHSSMARQVTLMVFMMIWTPTTSTLHLPTSFFPEQDQGYGYRDYYAKRIFPTQDQGYGYRDNYAKRIFPTQDQGYGYSNNYAKRIFPTQDQGYGYSNNYAKRIFPTQDQGYGYSNNYAKRIFPTQDQGYGYSNNYAKRVFPTQDQGYGYSNNYAKRIFPTQDQGYGYRDYYSIIPIDDQGHGYRDYRAKRIYPTEDQGQGYHDNYAKRIIPIDDQGHGYRNYRAKRIFPTENQGQGYRDYYAKRIFPTHEQGRGYRNYRAKRLSPDLGSSCNLCILTYDPDHCIRCWHSKSPIVPIFGKRSDMSSGTGSKNDDENGYSGDSMTSFSDYQTASPQLMQQDQITNNYSSVLEAESYNPEASQPQFRFQRGSGCGCCYLSRLTNQKCCRMCQITAKHSGNPLREESDSEGEVASKGAYLASSSEDDLPSKRAYLANPDCFCCLLNGNEGCCSRCYGK